MHSAYHRSIDAHPLARAAALILAAMVLACSPQDSLPNDGNDPADANQNLDAGGVGRTDTGGGGVRDPVEDIWTDPDTGPDWKYGTCDALFACSQAECAGKSDKNCDAACINAASATAQTQFTEYHGCVSSICYDIHCKDGDATCIAGCAAKHCTPMLLGCLGAGKTGTNGCSVLFKAQDACAKAQNSFKCLATSFATLTGAQQKAYIAMHKCLAASTAADPWAQCLSQVMACASDGQTGPKTCREVIDCEESCGNQAHLYLCLGTCFKNATKPAQGAYMAVKQCVKAAEDGKTTDGSCFKSVATCSEATGKTTCKQAWTCTNTCKGKGTKSELACVHGCLHNALPAEADAFAAWWGCKEAVCKPKCAKSKTCLESCYAATCGALGKACLDG